MSHISFQFGTGRCGISKTYHQSNIKTTVKILGKHMSSISTQKSACTVIEGIAKYFGMLVHATIDSNMTLTIFLVH